MAQEKSPYVTLISDLDEWVRASVEQDVVTAMQIVDRAKGYLNAAEALGAEEIATLESYLLRDLKAAAETFRDNAQQSLWLDSIKNRFLHLLASMSDQNRLQWFEAQIDIDHQGVYQSGEWVALGTLSCESCGHLHEIEFVEQIHDCVECGHNRFSHLTSSVS